MPLDVRILIYENVTFLEMEVKAVTMECQSCGRPMECAEDHADCDMEQEFCNYCMVEGEFTIKTRDEMKDKLVLTYKETMDIVDEEAQEKAERTLSGLKRWQ